MQALHCQNCNACLQNPDHKAKPQQNALVTHQGTCVRSKGMDGGSYSQCEANKKMLFAKMANEKRPQKKERNHAAHVGKSSRWRAAFRQQALQEERIRCTTICACAQLAARCALTTKQRRAVGPMSCEHPTRLRSFAL